MKTSAYHSMGALPFRMSATKTSFSGSAQGRSDAKSLGFAESVYYGIQESIENV